MVQGSKGAGDEHGKNGHDLIGRSPDGHRRGNLGPGADRGDSLVPLLLTGLGNDNMNPSHVERGERGLGDDGGKGGDQTMTQSSAHKGDEESCGHVPDQIHGQPAEARPVAGAGSEMEDGGSKGGGDGFVLDQQDIIVDLGIQVLIRGCLGGFGGRWLGRVGGRCRRASIEIAHRDIGSSFGGFDHTQGGDQMTIGVADLQLKSVLRRNQQEGITAKHTEKMMVRKTRPVRKKIKAARGEM